MPDGRWGGIERRRPLDESGSLRFCASANAKRERLVREGRGWVRGVNRTVAREQRRERLVDRDEFWHTARPAELPIVGRFEGAAVGSKGGFTVPHEPVAPIWAPCPPPPAVAHLADADVGCRREGRSLADMQWCEEVGGADSHLAFPANQSASRCTKSMLPARPQSHRYTYCCARKSCISCEDGRCTETMDTVCVSNGKVAMRSSSAPSALRLR